MFNNEITYHKKWDTPENKGFLTKLEREYFPRTLCDSSCPLSWSQEVYMLLKHLDKKYGIKASDQTIGGYHIADSNSILKRVFLRPFMEVYRDVFKTGPITDKTPSWQVENMKISWKKKLTKIPSIFWHHFIYGIRTATVQLKARTHNFIRRPKLGIDQVKEKYGTLRIYYGIDDTDADKYVSLKIKETEKTLSKKGAYYEIKDI